MGETTGQTIGMVVGGVIGGYFGGFQGAMLGMSIGGQLGLWIDPPDAPKPPPMGDIGQNSYVKSTPVPIAFGQVKIYGGVIWVGDMEAEMYNQGSRKNPEYSPKMQVDYAVAHCEGPIFEYLKYWINEKEVKEMKEEGMKFNFTSYYGIENDVIDSKILEYQANKSVPGIKLKWTAYTRVRVKVKDQILSQIPSVSAEIQAFDIEAGEEDANPIRCVYNFLTNTRWGVGLDVDIFNGDPDTVDSPWKIAADYCDENVQITDWDDSLVNEPRFRYSNFFDSRSMAFDVITDIMMTCRGIIRLKQGLIEPVIEHANEIPEAYFADRTADQFVAGGSSTVSRLYADFSAYPDIFWFGDEGIITISETDYRFLVKDQTSTYVDLFDDLPVSPNVSDPFEIVKDNIKEGSFKFKYTGDTDVPNRFRIEYIQRAVKDENNDWQNQYIWNVIEKDVERYYSTLDQYGTAPETKLKTIRLAGIKRKSQAMRMVQFYGDFAEYNRSWCEFTVGMQGYYHAIGDIIGISHAETGWNKKWFRVIGMEEAEGDEINMQCLEYNSSVYTDTIGKVTAPVDTVVPTQYEAPDIIELFYAVQDITYGNNKIYILFKRPDDNPYFIGIRIYVSVNGGDWRWKKTVGYLTSSVKLSAGIDNSQVTIGYDNSTLYGSFPASGSFWIEDELITYSGITGDPTYTFTGCGRSGSPVAHTIDKYIMLKDDYTDYIEYEGADIGQQWEIKAVSVTAFDLTADYTTSPTKVVTIS